MICESCGIEHKRTSNNQKYCKKCAKKRNIDRKKIWRQKHKKRRYCIDCNIDISHRGTSSKRCIECQKKAVKQYNDEYIKIKKHHIKQRQYELRWSIKQQAFFFYSKGYMKCNNCGCENICVLSIDHINGDGCFLRKKIPACKSTARYLVSNNFPDGYQILCRNCNWMKNLEQNSYEV